MVSVIIPVFNVEKYICKCVESVLKQTYQNFEIILVDDGSTDRSGEICDSFEDKRIRVIHKNNGGLSDARNVGTAAANGDFITWLDSDDFLHKNYLMILRNFIKNNDADMAVCEILFCKENVQLDCPAGPFKSETYDGMTALKKMLLGEMHGTSASALLIRSELAKKYLFPYGKYHEDDMTTYKFFIGSRKVAYTNQPLYHYLQREGSIMHSHFGQMDIDELDAADQIYSECGALGEEYKRAAFVKKTANYCQILFKYKNLKIVDRKTCDRINSFISLYFKNILLTKQIGRRTKLKLILYKMGMLNFRHLEKEKPL